MIIDTSFLFSKRIPVGQFFGANPEDAGIVLKEMSIAEAAKFQPLIEDTEKASAFFLALLPGIIVDHDLYRDETHKHEAKDVATMVSNRAEFFTYLMFAYVRDVLFSQGKKSK